MILAEMRITNNHETSIFVACFENLAEFVRYRKEINHPVFREWCGSDYEEECLSLTFTCRDFTEYEREHPEIVLDEYLDFLRIRDARF